MLRRLLALLALLHGLLAWGGHVMLEGTYTSPAGGIYPGTARAFQVYVPDRYDGRAAACLYVGLDSVLCDAPAVMDSLIAAGKMPVTIGVFVQPGVVRGAAGEVLRYNRSNEFDATDGTFARFLADQLLPAVAAMTTPDGRRLRWSDWGDDHMIFGLSSGGIAAFTAAWHRPDLFARVFSGVGTFVAMRGGNDLQAIVRKHEPRPLRVFLQDGTADVWNPLFGHWYEGNRMMASALEFAGCDCRFDWSDGGHNVSRVTAIFADVMVWMWRDWPAAIRPGTTLNDLLASLLVDGEPWRQAEARAFTPCARRVYSPDSALCVTADSASNWLWQAVRGSGGYEAGQRFYWLHSYDNGPAGVAGMAFDGDGNLWVVTGAGLQICDQNGRVRGIIALPPLGQDATVTIGDGLVTVADRNCAYTRRLRVRPPLPGQRPKSQGQG